MKYTVIIPVYNAEEKLSRCLDSILNQDYDDYEIILINDGSTDGSLKICQEYEKAFDNVLVIDKENGGAASARNKGLDCAKGEYILFVDSDDYVDEGYFSCVLKNSFHGGMGIMSFSTVGKSGVNKRNIPSALCNKDKNIDFFTKCRILVLSRTINSPVSKVFDRELIEKNNLRFDERMPVAEDFNFCLEYLMLCDDVILENTSVYFYDITNESSLVHKRKEGLIDIYPIVFDKAFDTICRSPFSNEQKNSLLRVWDKLHTDSFATCVMEELKDKNKTGIEKKSEIRSMCEKFYSCYKPEYGYENIVHFAVRLCIKNKWANILYFFAKIYIKLRD